MVFDCDVPEQEPQSVAYAYRTHGRRLQRSATIGTSDLGFVVVLAELERRPNDNVIRILPINKPSPGRQSVDRTVLAVSQ
jgi:hypothetical protein